MLKHIYVDGKLVEEHNDETRTVTFYYNGNITDTRDYTAAENAEADARQTHVDNGPLLTGQLRDSIPLLLGSVAALNVISGKTNSEITGKDTKDVAREARRIARQVIAIARLMTDTLDSANIGSDA